MDGLNERQLTRGRYHDARGAEYPLRAGYVFHRLPGLRHWTHPDPASRWLELFVQLPEHQWRPLAELGMFAEGARPWSVGWDAEGAARLVAVRDALADADEAGVAALTVEIAAVVAGWWRRWRDGRHPRARGWTAAACARLRDPGGVPAPLADVARSFGMAYPTFRQRFRARTGMTPGAYRNRMRMERACERLRTTALPLADIAREIGYANAYTFSREFRKMFRVPPGHFRRPPTREP